MSGYVIYPDITGRGFLGCSIPTTKLNGSIIFFENIYFLKWISTKMVFNKIDFIFSPVDIQTRVT
jgi:hypothetical protein